MWVRLMVGSRVINGPGCSNANTPEQDNTAMQRPTERMESLQIRSQSISELRGTKGPTPFLSLSTMLLSRGGSRNTDAEVFAIVLVARRTGDPIAGIDASAITRF